MREALCTYPTSNTNKRSFQSFTLKTLQPTWSFISATEGDTTTTKLPVLPLWSNINGAVHSKHFYHSHLGVKWKHLSNSTMVSLCALSVSNPKHLPGASIIDTSMLILRFWCFVTFCYLIGVQRTRVPVTSWCKHCKDCVQTLGPSRFRVGSGLRDYFIHSCSCKQISSLVLYLLLKKHEIANSPKYYTWIMKRTKFGTSSTNNNLSTCQNLLERYLDWLYL